MRIAAWSGCPVCFVCVNVGVCLVKCELFHGLCFFFQCVLFVCMLVCVWLNARCCMCFFVDLSVWIVCVCVSVPVRLHPQIACVLFVCMSVCVG